MIYTDTQNSFSRLIQSLDLEIIPLSTYDSSVLLSIQDYVLLSSYYPGQASDYGFLKIRQLRAAGHKCIIGLLTFENEQSLIKRPDALQGLQIFRLPLSAEEIREAILHAPLQIPEADIEFAIEKSQEAYLDETLLLLKHGKELELLNTTLNPMRAMSLNVLTGVSTVEKWNALRVAILHKLQNNPKYIELFLVVERLNNPNQKHYPVKLFFNNLFLSLSSKTETFEMKEFISEIDVLIRDFDSLFK